MNRTFPRPLLAAVALLAAAGCYRQVIRTFEITVPQMKTAAAAETVTRTIRQFDTNVVVAVTTDIDRKIVSVTYNIAPKPPSTMEAV